MPYRRAQKRTISIAVVDFAGQASGRIAQLLNYLETTPHTYSYFKSNETHLAQARSTEYDFIVISALDNPSLAEEFIKEFYRQPQQAIVICVCSFKNHVFRDAVMKLGVRDVLQPRELSPRVFERVLHFITQEICNKRQLEYRFQFESLFARVSTSLINLTGAALDQGINHALELLGRFAGVDRSYILSPSSEPGFLAMTHEWHHEEVDSALPYYTRIPIEYFSALLDARSPDAGLNYLRIEDLPDHPGELKKILTSRGVRSFAAFPMKINDEHTAFLGFALLRQEYWNKDAIALLQINSRIFTNALQRRFAEDALRESEKYYETLIEGLGEGILYCDRDDTIIHLNNRFALMMGYSTSEVLGKKAFKIFPDPQDAEDFRKRTERRLQGISEEYEIRLRRKDGSSFWALINSTPVLSDNGQITGTLAAITDISDKKQSSLALARSELKYRNLVETSSDLIWSVDCEGRWTFVNQASRHIHGYEPEEMLGRPFSDFLPEDQLEPDLHTFKQILQGKNYFSYETTHIRKDGSPVQLSFNAMVLRDEHGNVVGASGTATDITDKTLAQRDLVAQKEFLRLVIDTNPNLIYVKDKEGRFTLVNRAMANLFRCSVDAMIGKTLSDVYPNLPDLHEFAEQDRTVLDTGITRIMSEESAIDPFTGEERWFHTIKKPLLGPDGLPDQVLGISTDLTGRKRAEEALKAVVEGTANDTAKDFFRSLVHHLGSTLGSKFALVGVLDQSKEYVETLALWSGGEQLENVRYRRSGTPSEIVLQEGFTLFPENVLRLFPAAMAVQENLIESYMGAPIMNSEGERIGLLAVLGTEPMKDWPTAKYLINIFAARAGAEIDRIKTEEQRSSLQQQLTQSQKMEAIGQLAAGIAHDLNNALAAVTGHLQLMKMRDELTPKLSESVDVSLQGCERACSLIDQLLGFSRQGKYNLQICSTQGLVNQTLKFLEPVLDRRIEVRTQLPQEALPINIDPGQIQQALTNLLINAQHAINGSGTIDINTGIRRVDDASLYNSKAKAGKYAYIEVIDSGVGIKKEYQNKIFEPFFSTKPSREGSGLGLAMVYGTMQNHQGWISVSSVENKGATFTLYFPLMQISDDRNTAKVIELPREIKSAGAVLLIDDEESLIALASEFFKEHGFSVYSFSKPSEALEWYADNFSKIDTIILDMKMPRVSGPTCFHSLKQINPEAAIILLSGYIQDKAVQDLLRQGAIKFFQKPVKYAELVAWVAREISLRNKAA